MYDTSLLGYESVWLFFVDLFHPCEAFPLISCGAEPLGTMIMHFSKHCKVAIHGLLFSWEGWHFMGNSSMIIKPTTHNTIVDFREHEGNLCFVKSIGLSTKVARTTLNGCEV